MLTLNLSISGSTRSSGRPLTFTKPVPLLQCATAVAVFYTTLTTDIKYASHNHQFTKLNSFILVWIRREYIVFRGLKFGLSSSIYRNCTSKRHVLWSHLANFLWSFSTVTVHIGIVHVVKICPIFVVIRLKFAKLK